MTCATCSRTWAPLSGEPPWPLCPTCRTGQPPLSTLRAESKGKRPKPPEEQEGQA